MSYPVAFGTRFGILSLACSALRVFSACSSTTTPPPGSEDAGNTDAAVVIDAAAVPDAGQPVTVCAGLNFVGSCQAKDLCFDMYGVPEATAKGGCPAAVGTYQATACTKTSHVGGCERKDTPAPGGCLVQWYFGPTYTVSGIKSACAAPSGYVAP